MKGFIVISAKLIGYNNASSGLYLLTSREALENSNARTLFTAMPRQLHDSEHQIMQVTHFYNNASPELHL
jgi:hypothetical protein